MKLTGQTSFYRLIKKALNNYVKNDIVLRNSSKLGHPNKEIEYVRPNNEEKKNFLEIMVNFMGLYGSSSQLPSYMLDKFSRSDNENWKLFFDFFNNYLLWIFFESVSMQNYPKSFKKDFSDRISTILFNILGIDEKEVARSYLPFAPLLLSLRRPKLQIQRVLEYNFNLNNKLFILENIPHQVVIEPKQRSYLGKLNNRLSKNFILGKKALDYQSKMAIYINGINYDEAIKYFPKGQKYDKLKQSVIFLTNNEFAVDLYINIKYSPKMNLKLGDDSHSKLGYGSIIGKDKKGSYLMFFRLYS